MQPASAAKGPARLWGRLIPATVSLAALVAVTVVDTVLGVVPLAITNMPHQLVPYVVTFGPHLKLTATGFFTA